MFEENADWRSLRNRTVPQWLRDAKFGIYTHWGIYSVPAFGPNGSWYPSCMYRKGTEQYEHHCRTYGDPSVFGYKDFIPAFTGEKFDPDEWAELFRKAGAGFAGPVGEHHDGFAMWDTSYSEWNAARMGPRRDVVAALEKSIRGQGMKFMVAFHHMEHHYFYPHWHAEYDTADPRFAGLYGLPHDVTAERELSFEEQSRPTRGELDLWLGKVREVVDRFSPDALWFDFGLRFVQEGYKREMLRYYYTEAERKGQQVIVMSKNNDLCVGTNLIDLELGRFNSLMQNEWITDTTVDDGEGWGYLKDTPYKTPETLVRYLVDNVSKNGYLLVNVGPKPNGEIPAEARSLLLELGRWLEINGEAVYGTTPWLYYGEGPAKMEKSGDLTEREAVHYTAEDFRYTAKGSTIYATCLGWTGGEYRLRRLGELYPGEVASVRMLGVEQPLAWRQTDAGLLVTPPRRQPCSYAWVLKIERKDPFAETGPLR